MFSLEFCGLHEGRAASSSVGDSFASLMLGEAAHDTAPGASLAAALHVLRVGHPGSPLQPSCRGYRLAFLASLSR